MRIIIIFLVFALTFYIIGCSTYQRESENKPQAIGLNQSCMAKLLNSKPLTLGGPVPWCSSQPIYPKKAYENEIEGYVVLRFDVSKTGHVENIRVIESVPNGVFDAASVAAMSASFFLQSETSYKDVERKFSFVFPQDKE